jgi:hypothetical protein
MADPKLPPPASSKTPLTGNANDFIEQQLDGRLREIETLFMADAFSFSGRLVQGVDDLIRSAVEKMCAKGPAQKNWW